MTDNSPPFRGPDGVPPPLDDHGSTFRRERFVDLYSTLHDDLWRYCVRRCASTHDAEDIVSQVFGLAWARIDDVPPGADARPWLFAVARNHVRNGWRRQSSTAQLRDRIGNSIVGARIDTDESDREVDVSAALDRLSESDAEILRLAFWDDVSHREIAMVLGCTENAAAVRLHRARRRLRDEMADVRDTPAGEPSHLLGDDVRSRRTLSDPCIPARPPRSGTPSIPTPIQHHTGDNGARS